jgi:hypothetical protein
MRIRAAATITVAVTLALCAAGCAGSGGAHTGGSGSGGAQTATVTASVSATARRPGARTPATVAQLCGPPQAPGRLITIRAADGVRLAAIEVGAGEHGVVLIPELGAAGKCGWWDYAAYLAAHGITCCCSTTGAPGGVAAHRAPRALT